MSTAWHRTRLSMDVPLADGTETPILEMADTDRKKINVSAGETVASVAVVLATYSAPTTTHAASIESAVLNGSSDEAEVIVTDLTRGTLYELQVTFTRADGFTWTRTLAIRCVA